MPITVTTQDLSHPSSLPTRSAPLYLIFHSSPWDPVSQSWCPDCRNARAALLDVFQSQDGAEAWVLLTDREQWKKKSEGEAQHPWRDQAGWGVKCLPTLLRVEGGKETGRLEEEECQNAKTIRDFVAGARGAAK